LSFKYPLAINLSNSLFIQIFFLLLTLILVSFEASSPIFFWVSNAATAFEISLAIYIALLFLIGAQTLWIAKRRGAPSTALHIATIELLCFLCLFHFGLGAQRFLQEETLPIITSILSLSLYLLGLGWTHYCCSRFKLVYDTPPLTYAYQQIQFLLPFCIPFILFGFIFDLLNLIPAWVAFSNSDSYISTATFILLNATLLVMIFLFIPPVIIFCWRCKPLQDRALTSRLEAVCQQMHFKHAGLKTWTVMKHTFTAGIIGALPRFRYIMFTEKLLHSFSFEEIEAILIHEIGHSRYKHLLFYPFIFLGTSVLGAFFFLFFSDVLFTSFMWFGFNLSSTMSVFFFNLSLFICYALLLGFYLRLVFGFFSRLFERQADLHIFEYPTAPSNMIQALNRLGDVMGGIHDQPSWHHFSIRQRTEFLQVAIDNPMVVTIHHRKVKLYLGLYFLCLSIGSLILLLLQ
jgi:STE24 endopeptidase